MKATLAMKKILIALALVVTASTPAWSIANLEILHKQNETVVFGGIQWNFGSSKPELVLGARSTQSNSTSHVTGVKFEMAIPMDSIRWKMPTFRAMGLAGSCDVQGEAGLGWNFATNHPLFALGVQAPYSTLGVNYSIPNSFAPYLGVNSLRKPACAFKANAPL